MGPSHLGLEPLHPTRPFNAEPRCERRWASTELACVAGELSAVTQYQGIQGYQWVEESSRRVSRGCRRARPLYACLGLHLADAAQPAELRISFYQIINRTPSLQYASTDPRIPRDSILAYNAGKSTRVPGAICKIHGLFGDKNVSW